MYKILNNHTAPNLRTSFRLNNECDNTYDLRNREPICLFLNRIPILVKDASNITERYIVWSNLPYEAKVAGSLSCFQRTINQANT